MDRGVKRAHFGVLRGARMPAVVIETGFLSHPSEGRDVLERWHRARVVGALVTAIEKFDTTRSATHTQKSPDE
jgi:N-acetylmuramoyl-L-alanine amidase